MIGNPVLKDIFAVGRRRNYLRNKLNMDLKIETDSERRWFNSPQNIVLYCVGDTMIFLFLWKLYAINFGDIRFADVPHKEWAQAIINTFSVYVWYVIKYGFWLVTIHSCIRAILFKKLSQTFRFRMQAIFIILYLVLFYDVERSLNITYPPGINIWAIYVPIFVIGCVIGELIFMLLPAWLKK